MPEQVRLEDYELENLLGTVDVLAYPPEQALAQFEALRQGLQDHGRPSDLLWALLNSGVHSRRLAEDIGTQLYSWDAESKLGQIDDGEFRLFVMLYDQLRRITGSQLGAPPINLLDMRLVLQKRLDEEGFLSVSSKGGLYRFLAHANSGMVMDGPFGTPVREHIEELLGRTDPMTALEDYLFLFLVNEETPLLKTSPHEEETVNEYPAKAANRKRYLRDCWEEDGFLFARGGSPAPLNTRVYVNPRAEFMTELFTAFRRELLRSGAYFNMKTPMLIGDGGEYRTDKLVIYGDIAQREKLRAAVDRVYQKHRPMFGFETPKFAIPWRRGPQFQRADGIAVTTQPRFRDQAVGERRGRNRSDFSHNSLMAHLLAHMTVAAHEQGLWVGDPSFPAAQVFDQLCRERDLNPDIPALNASSDPQAIFELATGQPEFSIADPDDGYDPLGGGHDYDEKDDSDEW